MTSATAPLSRFSYGRVRRIAAPGDVPVEHFTSYPVPTLRFGQPGLASFASPCRRRPPQPLVVSAPDRWWLRGAAGRPLLAYGLTEVVPFALGLDSVQETLTPPGRSIAQLGEDLTELDDLMDQAVPAFFSGDLANPALLEDVAAAFAAVVAPQTRGWYSALAPDFFAWLRPL